MPDFFAPLSVLIIFILLKKKNISIFAWITLSIILIYSMISHFSHLLIGSVLIAIILILKYSGNRYLFSVKYKRILITACIIFSSWLILPGINTIVENKFILAKGSHVMFMAHLNQTGILKKFLDEKCDDDEFKDCVLCHYKDSLPTDLASFIWSEKQILQKCGGWINSKDEFNKIIIATLSEPKYLFLNIYKSLTYGLIQLTDNKIGSGLSGYNKGSAPYGLIEEKFPDELNDYLLSRENLWNGVKLKLETLNIFHLFLLFFSLYFVVLIFTTSLVSKLDSDTVFFLLFVIMGIVINSFTTAGLSSPYGRYQARVVWMLPFALAIILSKDYNTLIKTFRNKFPRH